MGLQKGQEVFQGPLLLNYPDNLNFSEWDRTTPPLHLIRIQISFMAL